MAPFQLETIEVQGSNEQLGLGQGEAFRERIQRFIEVRFKAMQGYFAERGRPNDWVQVEAIGEKSRAIYKEWDPAGHAEMVGIAKGANVPVDRLFTATNMTDMRDAVLLAAPRGAPLKKLVDEGCSSLLIPGAMSQEGHALAGQTWDLNPTDIDYVVGVKRKADEGPETWAVTCAGCLTLMGINEHGLSVGTTNIKTYGSRPGVGYLSILHRVVRAKDVAEASALVKGAPHAGAHTYWLADENALVEYEASPNAQYERKVGSESLFRTNHCIFGGHVELQGEVVGASSEARFARLQTLLAGKMDVASLKTVFADRADGTESINRYAEDEQGTATNAVFIAEPVKKRAFACRGPADRGEWVELSFSS